MGNKPAKSEPLTADDLNAALETALQPLVTKTDLDNKLKPIQNDLKALKGALLVPEGDSVARTTTVQIQKGGYTFGHGVVVVDDTSAEATYYLVSAAHVLVYFKPNEKIVLHNQSQEVMEAQVNEFYLPRSYVEEGKADVAIFSLRDVNISKKPEMVTFQFGLPEVGQGAVAHGSVFLRGTVTMIQEWNLFTVLAHSVPGSGGLPLFDDRKFLVGLVHGSSKHRGKHASGEREDASVVYCYSLHDCEFFPARWDNSTQRRLEWAEDIPLELANGSQNFSVFTKTDIEGQGLNQLARDINYTINGDSSLDGLMKQLAETIWPSPAQRFQIQRGWKMATWSN